MAEENNDVVNSVSDDTNQSQADQATEVNVADVEARIAELETQIAKQQEIVEKARKGEKYQKSKADSEVKKIQAQYEAVRAHADALEQKIRHTAADTALKLMLQESGAKAVDTALKLVDRKALKFSDDGSVVADSAKAAIETLKASDSFLFDSTNTTAQDQATKLVAPPAKRATEADKVSGFESEIRAANSAQDLQSVLRKYGKL